MSRSLLRSSRRSTLFRMAMGEQVGHSCSRAARQAAHANGDAAGLWGFARQPGGLLGRARRLSGRRPVADPRTVRRGKSFRRLPRPYVGGGLGRGERRLGGAHRGSAASGGVASDRRSAPAGRDRRRLLAERTGCLGCECDRCNQPAGRGGGVATDRRRPPQQTLRSAGSAKSSSRSTARWYLRHLVRSRSWPAAQPIDSR